MEREIKKRDTSSRKYTMEPESKKEKTIQKLKFVMPNTTNVKLIYNDKEKKYCPARCLKWNTKMQLLYSEKGK